MAVKAWNPNHYATSKLPTFPFLKWQLGTWLVVQSLGICLPELRMCVQSLVRELRSHMLWDNWWVQAPWSPSATTSEKPTRRKERPCLPQSRPSAAKDKQINNLKTKGATRKCVASRVWPTSHFHQTVLNLLKSQGSNPGLLHCGFFTLNKVRVNMFLNPLHTHDLFSLCSVLEKF